MYGPTSWPSFLGYFHQNPQQKERFRKVSFNNLIYHLIVDKCMRYSKVTGVGSKSNSNFLK